MSEENASQTNTEDAISESAPEIGKPVEGEEGSGPAPIYEDTESEPEVAEKVEPKAEEQKEDDQETTEGDNEDFSLSKPEDSLLSAADMESIAEYAKEQGLSKDAANKLVEYQSEALGEFHDQQMDNHAKQVSAWGEECKADSEIGGDKYAESVELAKRVVQKFGSENFMDALNATGFGNNPEVVRVFARIGKSMSSDSLVRSSVDVGSNRSMEDVFYGTNKD